MSERVNGGGGCRVIACFSTHILRRLSRCVAVSLLRVAVSVRTFSARCRSYMSPNEHGYVTFFLCVCPGRGRGPGRGRARGRGRRRRPWRRRRHHSSFVVLWWVACRCTEDWCLFNVTADPCEYVDLAKQFPDVVLRLQQNLVREAAQMTGVE